MMESPAARRDVFHGYFLYEFNTVFQPPCCCAQMPTPFKAGNSFKNLVLTMICHHETRHSVAEAVTITS